MATVRNGPHAPGLVDADDPALVELEAAFTGEQAPEEASAPAPAACPYVHKSAVVEPPPVVEAPAQKPPQDDGATLFSKLGGRKALHAAVNTFHKKIMGDDRVNFFFEGIDLNRLKLKQIQFFAFAFGGADKYTGRDLGVAHCRLKREKGLNITHFDIVVEHLVATLKDLKVAQEHIDQAVSNVETTRHLFKRSQF